MPVHNKGDKQYAINYRLIYLLPFATNLPQRLIFKEVVTFSTESNLILPNYPCFISGDTYVNQPMKYVI